MDTGLMAIEGVAAPEAFGLTNLAKRGLGLPSVTTIKVVRIDIAM
jgi:hypothetical protein